jgi:hypothetical protein
MGDGSDGFIEPLISERSGSGTSNGCLCRIMEEVVGERNDGRCDGGLPCTRAHALQ